MTISVQRADLTAKDMIALIEAHAELMLKLSPPGSCHFLPIAALNRPDVSVWDMREDDGRLLGCGGLQELGDGHGEIKSMHTLPRERGRGLGRKMLEYILEQAQARNYRRLSLETGSMDGFAPARQLYEAYGFTYCEPFEDYSLDPNSVYMTKALQ